MDDNSNVKIKLVDITTADFNAKQLLQVLLYRDRLTNNLIYLLHQAQKRKLIDDKHDYQYIQILKVCVNNYSYYQVLQTFNFLKPGTQRVKMANQFYKIFEDQDSLSDRILDFQRDSSGEARQQREEIQARYNTVLKWRERVELDWRQLLNHFSQDNPDYIKFYKLREQLEKENQTDFDIYGYYFQLFYSDDWFPNADQCNDIEIIKLQCFCRQFKKLDYVYAIELYPNQTSNLIEIQDRSNDIQYYRDKMKQ